MSTLQHCSVIWLSQFWVIVWNVFWTQEVLVFIQHFQQLSSMFELPYTFHFVQLGQNSLSITFWHFVSLLAKSAVLQVTTIDAAINVCRSKKHDLSKATFWWRFSAFQCHTRCFILSVRKISVYFGGKYKFLWVCLYQMSISFLLETMTSLILVLLWGTNILVCRKWRGIAIGSLVVQTFSLVLRL